MGAVNEPSPGVLDGAAAFLLKHLIEKQTHEVVSDWKFEFWTPEEIARGDSGLAFRRMDKGDETA